MIDQFNARFHVPFRLKARNKEKVILAQEKQLYLDFVFDDGADAADVERDALLAVLSTGEKKAFYILNILFEVEVRRDDERKALFVIDDLADSFDYKNKYAIIQYLKEMADQPNFRLILLTHNFDFLRTSLSRQVVGSERCFMAEKNGGIITLPLADAVNNPLSNFKAHFHDDGAKRVAAIPFVRNILEYTKGTSDPAYGSLTSLLHWKSDSKSITEADLDAIFSSTFVGASGKAWATPGEPVVDLILHQADVASTAADGANFANKIVMSIAIRLLAEQHMVDVLADPNFSNGITSNQTPKLLNEYKSRELGDAATYETLDAVLLMTPENIHVNSFMYEPIIDMSDAALRELYSKVKALQTTTTAAKG